MNRRLLDILVCPIDRHAPLELVETESTGDVISEGALHCSECRRFYPILEGIPIMLPDDLRDKKLEIPFLKRNESRLPAKITQDGLPWHL